MRPRPATATTVRLVVVAVAVVVAIGVVVGSPLVGATGAVVAAVAIVEWSARRRRRIVSARIEALPNAVDELINRLRSGYSLVQAATGLEAELLGPLTDALARGEPLVSAARILGDRSPDPSARLVATTLEVLATNGGPAVSALQRLRLTLIGRAHRRHRAEAQAAGARASAALLAGAPALFALVLAAAEPDLAAFYLWEPLGTVCATASIVLSAGGWFWIQRSVGRAGAAS